jgi:hypothetical protein
VNGSMQQSVRSFGAGGVILALAIVIGSGTFGVASAEPLARLRVSGVSVTATFSDEAQGYLRVAASRVTFDGQEQVYLDVLDVDNVTETMLCGSALLPASALRTAADAIGLRVNLSSLEWLTECEDGNGVPTGDIDLTFKADGAFRTTSTGTTHQWLPTYVIHSTGTSEDESALVRGQLLNVAPGQSISGQVSRFSSRVISIERR